MKMIPIYKDGKIIGRVYPKEWSLLNRVERFEFDREKFINWFANRHNEFLDYSGMRGDKFVIENLDSLMDIEFDDVEIIADPDAEVIVAGDLAIQTLPPRSIFDDIEKLWGGFIFGDTYVPVDLCIYSRTRLDYVSWFGGIMVRCGNFRSIVKELVRIIKKYYGIKEDLSAIIIEGNKVDDDIVPFKVVGESILAVGVSWWKDVLPRVAQRRFFDLYTRLAFSAITFEDRLHAFDKVRSVLRGNTHLEKWEKEKLLEIAKEMRKIARKAKLLDPRVGNTTYSYYGKGVHVVDIVYPTASSSKKVGTITLPFATDRVVVDREEFRRMLRGFIEKNAKYLSLEVMDSINLQYHIRVKLNSTYHKGAHLEYEPFQSEFSPDFIYELLKNRSTGIVNPDVIYIAEDGEIIRANTSTYLTTNSPSGISIHGLRKKGFVQTMIEQATGKKWSCFSVNALKEFKESMSGKLVSNWEAVLPKVIKDLGMLDEEKLELLYKLNMLPTSEQIMAKMAKSRTFENFINSNVALLENLLILVDKIRKLESHF